jgi:hypothetical protein
MRRSPLLVTALLVSACGGASPGTSAPCGPCQAQASAGLQNVGLPRSAKLDQLAARRVEMARKRLGTLRASFDQGRTTLDELVGALRDVAFAAHDSGLHGETLRDILKEYRDALVALKDVTAERVSKGAVTEDAVIRMDLLVVEAEFWLEEANQGL